MHGAGHQLSRILVLSHSILEASTPRWVLPSVLRFSRRELARVKQPASGRPQISGFQGTTPPPAMALWGQTQPPWDASGQRGARGSWIWRGPWSPRWDSKLFVCLGPPPLTPTRTLSRFSHLSPGISRSRKDPVPKVPVATVAIGGDPATPTPPTSTAWAPGAPSTLQPTGGCPAALPFPTSCPESLPLSAMWGYQLWGGQGLGF